MEDGEQVGGGESTTTLRCGFGFGFGFWILRTHEILTRVTLTKIRSTAHYFVLVPTTLWSTFSEGLGSW